MGYFLQRGEDELNLLYLAQKRIKPSPQKDSTSVVKIILRIPHLKQNGTVSPNHFLKTFNMGTPIH
jgi:hypothetical protein